MRALMRLHHIRRPTSATALAVAHVRLGGEGSHAHWSFDAIQGRTALPPRLDEQSSNLQSRLAGLNALRERSTRHVTDTRCPFDDVTRLQARISIITNSQAIRDRQRKFENRQRTGEVEQLREQLRQALAATR